MIVGGGEALYVPLTRERVVASIASLAHLAPAVRAEHERWDGRGYPDGLLELQLARNLRPALAASHAGAESMPRLFALDHNFPDPIVAVLTEFQADAELVRVDQIDDRMPDLDDWELLLALHHHSSPWDGLITTDSSTLNQGPELAALIQTKLTPGRLNFMPTV